MIELEKFHSIFYQVVDFGCRPIFVSKTTLPTACIQYNKSGLSFLFCDTFFDNLSDEEAKFVICHEMLHVLLNHGVRFKKSLSERNPVLQSKVNKALDIAINESLVDFFGFDRKDLPYLEAMPLCFIDTIFKDTTDILRGQTGEYYYSKMLDDDNLQSGGEEGGLLNDHTQFITIDELLEKIGQGMSSYEKQKLKNMIKNQFNSQAGTAEGGLLDIACLFEQPKKVRWETVIRNWVDITKRQLFPQSNWASEDRRFYDVVRRNDFILPGHRELPKNTKNRIKLFFFLDTSGSCIGFANRFFTAASTINQDYFELHLLNFDTRVYETDLKSRKVYGGGGTYFHIIPEYIRGKAHKDDKWAAFVLTDGMGNDPQIGDKEAGAFHWFLTCDYKKLIPAKSKIHMLEDFE